MTRAGHANVLVKSMRGPKNLLNPHEAYDFLWEEECQASGELLSTITVFLTNRECPYRCIMCDLWKNTLDETVPPGAIAHQIDLALQSLPPARQIKLYNAGSFFDRMQIPLEDYASIADRLATFERVVVESHPAFVGERTWQFSQMIAGQLEVAIGLETCNPLALGFLNKQFTLAQFKIACEKLADHHIRLRVFTLLNAPGVPATPTLFWEKESLRFAFECGADVCVIIPTRGGNGMMEQLARDGIYTKPGVRSIEAVLDYGLSLGKGTVYADTWNIDDFVDCACSRARIDRIQQLNKTQLTCSRIACATCDLKDTDELRA